VVLVKEAELGLLVVLLMVFITKQILQLGIPVSDRRIKKNIVDNNVGLNKIAQIQVRDFEYRDFDEVTDFENPKAVHVDKPGVQIGVIAQEIEDIFPEMIITQSTGVKTFNSEKLVFYLINAVKELKTRIEILENK
jgi:hypothetical protein